MHLRVFRLIAPDAGTHDVNLAWSGGATFYAVAVVSQDVDQADPDDAQVTVDGSGGGTSSTLNVTSGATGDLVLDFLVSGNGITALAPTAGGQTELQQQVGHGSGMNSMGVSWKAGAASVTMSWSWTGFTAYVGWAFNVNAGGESTVLVPGQAQRNRRHSGRYM